jgi:hypothetical protein
MKRTKSILLALLFTFISAFIVTGCGKKSDNDARHFKCAFKDSKGLRLGDRVNSGSGAYLGQIEGEPELLIQGKEELVVIPIIIDKLSSTQLKRLTKDIKVYAKQNMIKGVSDSWIEIELASTDGAPLENGVLLRGVDSIGPISIPGTPEGTLRWIIQGFGINSIETLGLLPFLSSWTGLFAILLLVIVMSLDLLFRLPQGLVREKSSPRLFQLFWNVFIIVFFLKGLFLVFTLGGILGKLQFPSSLIQLPPSISSALIDGSLFWLSTLILITLRFKLQLLVKVKDYSGSRKT